jgi:pimeloyl-ACP methyl ester carboxylesterase
MTATLKRARTSVLDIAYEESGAVDGTPIFLVHGFPDDVRTWDGVAVPLAAQGYRVIVPYLRGYGPTRFLAPSTMRSGQQGAIGSDLKELMDALGIARAFLAGYDWGGRAACIVAALWPERVRGLVSIGGYNIQDIAKNVKPEPADQEWRFWYQWYFNTARGVAASPPTGTRSAACSGRCGRRTGPSTTRPMRRPAPLSTIPTMLTSSSTPTAIATRQRRANRPMKTSSVAWP